jgi:hypothetical protein
MKKTFCFALWLVLEVSAFAQTREDVKIFIPPVKANADQAAFFMESFTMETMGAGYTLAANERDADYSLELEVKPNMILYDDGTEEQAPPGEKQFNLNIDLIRNKDNANLVSFSFLFDDLDEMHEFDLYLLYEAMANVPMTKEYTAIAAEEPDFWRNKWLYLRGSFDYPVTFYELLEPSYVIDETNQRAIHLDHRISPFPGATLGLELQYLKWMSTEVNFQLCFSDPSSNSMIPTIVVEQKFPIKPSTIYMVEPYLAVAFPMPTSTVVKQFPRLGAGGGFQFGVKGGNMGAFFLDVNYIYFLGDAVMENPYYLDGYTSSKEVHYTRYTLGLGIGYKIGFFNRSVRRAN